MSIFRPLLAACILTLSARAEASPPLPPETIAAIDAALSECTGGWYEIHNDWRLVGAKDIAPRTVLLARPSTELDAEAGKQLYNLAKGLLVPAVPAAEVPEWIMDKGASLKCPARPAEALALLEYLAGDGPNDWRGATNSLAWLGLAYETGIARPPDPERARRYYLRSRIHSSVMPNDRWSDGIDDDLIANIERAGLRGYLDTLGRNERTGGGARMILAEEALPSDPAMARALLRVNYTPALNQLLKWENEGRIPTPADANDIAFWSEAWRTQMGFEKWAMRMLKGVSLANGGVIPTAPDRPSIEDLRPYLDTERVADAYATRRPLPVRALVDPQGRALYIETCRDNDRPIGPRTGAGEKSIRLDAARLYSSNNLAALPRLAPPTIDGRPVYGWVILPAVQFQRPRPDKLEFSFSDLPAESCAFSDMLPPPPLVPAP